MTALLMALFISNAHAQTRDVFWQDFRSAFLRSDIEKLKSLSAFPLTIKSEVDSESNLKVDRANFGRCMRIILKHDSGGVDRPRLIMEEVRMRSTLDGVTGDNFQVGVLLFERLRGQYRLTAVRINTEEPTIQMNCRGEMKPASREKSPANGTHSFGGY